MSYLTEMEWNAKFLDWENFALFGSKTSESPKKLQLVDWTFDDEGEIDTGSFNLSGGSMGNSGASGSDAGHGSSAKSSISASTDSSPKDGLKTPNFAFEALEGSSGDFGKKMVMIGSEGSPLEASVGSVEPLIGLKLGPTCFESSSVGSNGKRTSVSVVPAAPHINMTKKTKPSGQNMSIPYCQVEGCNLDLSMAKDYHRKHRVCESHSKSPKVIVGGVERRFCQQCSRFHGLSEFDEKKRSCRRRLSDHNARRRKPQQDTIQFNSTRLPSPFYDGRQQMNFLLSNDPLIQSRNAPRSAWDGTCSPKFTLTKGFSSKSSQAGEIDMQLHMPGIQLPHVMDMRGSAANGVVTPRRTTSDVCSQGFKESVFSSHLDAAPEYRRALSLLSSNSWVSCESESIALEHPMHENGTNIPPPVVRAIPEAVPLASSELWQAGQQSTQPHRHSLAANNYREVQLFKAPYDTDLYSNSLN